MVVNNLALPYDGLRWADYPVDRLVSRCVERFVTGSAAAASQLRQVLQLESGKVVSLHNGIEPRAPDEPRQASRARLGVAQADSVCFGVVALMESRKGHRVLVDAIAKLSGDHPKLAQSIIVLLEGDGPERDSLARQVDAHALVDRVRFVGTEKNIAVFLQAIDVMILPSVALEDFPNVVLEAMAAGKPVIASRLAGIAEQIEHETTGLLVEPGDAAALSSAIARMASSGLLRRSYGDAGRARFVQRFTARVAVDRYMAMYAALLENRRIG
jgi:glycosyltransferase involved in cell wall biosynthesis